MAFGKPLQLPGDIDKEPELRDKVMILAYLEELATLGAPVQLMSKDEFVAPIQARLEHVNEEKRVFQVALNRALPGTLKAKDTLTLLFPLDGRRYLAEVSFRERPGYLKAEFAFPQVVKLGERRTMPRVRFGPREHATITLLEGLFEGHGATGRLVNISLGGACVRIDRAISVQGQRRVAITPELFQPGAKLELIRILDLPHIPTLECHGRALHSARSPMGVTVGITFEEMDSLDVQMLHQLVHKRLPGEVVGFPIKYPKSRRQLSPDEAEAPAPVEESWEDVPEVPESAEEAKAPVEEIIRPDTRAKLMQIKKRGKRILVVMLDDMDRAILLGTLQVDGFTRTGEARNFLEATSWLRQNRPDVMIIDHAVGMHSAQQMIEKFRAQGLLEDIPVIMLANEGDVKALIKAKAIGVSKVLKHPVNYDGGLRPALWELLNLNWGEA